MPHGRQLEGDLELYFWRNSRQEEVDFVLKRGLKVFQLIQVCANVEYERTRGREVRALLKASQELRCKDLLVLTETAEREERVSWYGLEGTVRFLPLWKWLASRSVS